MAFRQFLICVLALVPLLTSCLIKPEPFDETKWRTEVLNAKPADLYAPHEKDGLFYNPWMIPGDRGFGQFLKWRLSLRSKYPDQAKILKPNLVPNLVARIDALPHGSDFIVWIGHATFLMRFNGVYWLTDPMLSDRALLPKRITPPALTMAEISDIKGEINVLISHNHYDHLDEDTLRALPDHARIFVPLGLKTLVSTFHDGPIHELDWWQEHETQETVVTCLPSQHWSRRVGQSRNATLWASYMIETQGIGIYFAGDSGYFIGYKEFGRKFENIDYALLPITAYHPRWFMHYAHINVEEALAAYEDLKAKYFVPTQWGTFHLGDNPPGFPMFELNQKIQQMDLDSKKYLRPSLGEIILLIKRKG
ncbi:MAG: hypothetical protein HKP41_01745 [Desulfobacterales bacterium]|nr:hypothetical protein [Desulfobacterales bacterium]